MTQEPLTAHVLAMLSVDPVEIVKQEMETTLNFTQRGPAAEAKTEEGTTVDLGMLFQQGMSKMLMGQTTCLDLLPIFVQFMSYRDEIVRTDHFVTQPNSP